MALLVRVLLVLAHLAVTVVSEHGLKQMEDKYQSASCKKLMRMIMWCGYEKDWRNQIQRTMADHMGASSFSTEVDKCLATSLDPKDGMSYCTDIKSLRVYLQCSRTTLFNRVDVNVKFAALMFHRGFEHCVKVNMDMMEEDLGMLPDKETDPSDYDDDRSDTSDSEETDRPEKPPRRGGAVYDEERHNYRHNHRVKPGDQYGRPVRQHDYRKPSRPYHEDFRPQRRPPHDYGDYDDYEMNRHKWRNERNRHKWNNDREMNRHDRWPDEDFGVTNRRYRRSRGDRHETNRHYRHDNNDRMNRRDSRRRLADGEDGRAKRSEFDNDKRKRRSRRTRRN